jgi:hypothetical protein
VGVSKVREYIDRSQRLKKVKVNAYVLVEKCVLLAVDIMFLFVELEKIEKCIARGETVDIYVFVIELEKVLSGVILEKKQMNLGVLLAVDIHVLVINLERVIEFCNTLETIQLEE